ncbi:hypothetical protein AWRIB568_1162 [Oenococcus oeni AWRIB568]|uniref:Uncharacterized protein n=1 Tax=Oenococcus oeni AWRIB429 TaxID=655225 RepID=D3LBT6_OENOE|nr:hypothetical protein AWRIB429_1816 [Oenococcus oeni AWRIB429]EJN92584.1 hypothetical protein AWRIB304_1030 [Oenococcus oeni AWRIB304]EJO01054.1 hypothetical protein AWRIB318_1229 [Oenococcus oeni AWRIB318]EJO05431.1 hypothetical protein AWRIB548_1067 [Oenococcus oeni AWRIB548]EJO07407.1 hypothetical protein AWRIB422_409 [Oenococcus oeni AWRIB422]EJO10441.1 hypothetical protein AWRIB576_1237 [Oenococcus oeni AWRIB576]EJO11024.1 hypothetical protein AWRIB568_1162 [Oenococcus oeni AWRIB568]E
MFKRYLQELLKGGKYENINLDHHCYYDRRLRHLGCRSLESLSLSKKFYLI